MRLHDLPFQFDAQMVLSLIFSFVIGILTAYYARSKGRDPTAWFILGFLFTIFAPIVLYFLSDLNEKTNEPTMTVEPPDSSLAQTKPSSSYEPSPEENKLWYYLDRNHQQQGPVSLIALRELWKTGDLELTNYVWTEGMDKWEIVDHLPGLKEALSRPSPL